MSLVRFKICQLCLLNWRRSIFSETIVQKCIFIFTFSRWFGSKFPWEPNISCLMNEFRLQEYRLTDNSSIPWGINFTNTTVYLSFGTSGWGLLLHVEFWNISKVFDCPSSCCDEPNLKGEDTTNSKLLRVREFLFFIYNADKIYFEKRTAMLPLMLPYVQYHLLPDVSY